MTQNAKKPPHGATYDLRDGGLVMTDGQGEVHEFTGMWPIKPDADFTSFTNTLAYAEYWTGPGGSFTEATTALNLIRTARWFIGTSTEYGPTLYFIAQFDSNLEKYFDDFVLNGKTNLLKVWGTCIGCPNGPDVTARDVVNYIARGQIKTLACYDGFPSLSGSQIQKQADWYEKTKKFQRAVMTGGGSVEEKVDAFLAELAKPYTPVKSAATIDTDVVNVPQYTDIAERLGVNKKAA